MIDENWEEGYMEQYDTRPTPLAQGVRVRVLVPNALGHITRWIIYSRGFRPGYWLCHGVGRQIDRKSGFRYRVVVEAEFKEEQIEAL